MLVLPCRLGAYRMNQMTLTVAVMASRCLFHGFNGRLLLKFSNLHSLVCIIAGCQNTI